MGMAWDVLVELAFASTVSYIPVLTLVLLLTMGVACSDLELLSVAFSAHKGKSILFLYYLCLWMVTFYSPCYL